jgi:hypothetical protein
MGLKARVSRLENAAFAGWDLSLLTDAELEALIACYQKADETGKPAHLLITPGLAAALERVRL